MTISFDMITIDCKDPHGLAAFWGAALGVKVDSDYGDYVMVERSGDGKPFIAFQKVPEDKSGKNRVHLDFMTADRVSEVTRLVGLGAKPVAEHDMPGLEWTTLADPEGNEFDVAQEVASSSESA